MGNNLSDIDINCLFIAIIMHVLPVGNLHYGHISLFLILIRRIKAHITDLFEILHL